MIDSKKFWIGLVVSVIFLALFVLTIDLPRMFEAVAKANYFWLIPGIGLYLISVLFRTIRWRILLRHMRPIGIRRLYPVVVVGYMANNLLPMRLGELVRSYYIGERENISKTSALVTIFVERVLDALTLLFFIAALTPFVSLIGLGIAFGEQSGISWSIFLIALSAFPLAFTFLLLLLISRSQIAKSPSNIVQRVR